MMAAVIHVVGETHAFARNQTGQLSLFSVVLIAAVLMLVIEQKDGAVSRALYTEYETLLRADATIVVKINSW